MSSTRDNITEYETGVYKRNKYLYLNFVRKITEFHSGDLSKFLDDPNSSDLKDFLEID
jgi:hypothetical protein